MSDFPNYETIYTDGSKDGDTAGSACVTPSDTYKCRLPDSASIFSAEIKAIDLALDHIEQSRNSDSAPSQTAVMSNILSDNDVLRVAMKVKAIMMEEIETLVKLKVNEATAELKQDVKFLKDENSKLKDEIKKLENTCKSNIDDLEQYSRRSCVRISGIKEEEGENTDELVLNLARRVSADIRPEDLDRSHRVGRPREVSQNTNTVPRPREIIVKLTNYRARMQLLKGRAFLRSTKAKIFINEDLTSARKEIAYECRGLKRDNKIRKVWTYNGNIFIIDNHDVKKQISSMSELDVYKH